MSRGDETRECAAAHDERRRDAIKSIQMNKRGAFHRVNIFRRTAKFSYCRRGDSRRACPASPDNTFKRKNSGCVREALFPIILSSNLYRKNTPLLMIQAINGKFIKYSDFFFPLRIAFLSKTIV